MYEIQPSSISNLEIKKRATAVLQTREIKESIAADARARRLLFSFFLSIAATDSIISLR